MVAFYKIWKKYKGVQLPNTNMDLNNQKMKKSSTFPQNCG